MESEKPSESKEENTPKDIFWNKLNYEGWMTNPDGEDLCFNHWEKYLSKFSDEEKKIAEQDSKPTSSLVSSRKIGDGYLVHCHEENDKGELCKENIFVPFEEENN